jgi:hypothetical protein
MHMIRLALVVLVSLLSLPAFAGTITVGGQSRTTTAAQDAAMATRRTQHNANLCASKSLVVSCTQAQLNAVSGCEAGACGTIYASNAAGTADYFLDQHAMKIVAEVESQTAAIERGDALRAWNEATPAQRANMCLAAGKDANCR